MENQSTQPGAMHGVLQIPELLELILSHLPRLELLLAQRTSKTWQEVISTSPILQKHLFMRADWNLEGRYADEKPGARPLNNLMLRQIMGGMYPTMTLRLLNFETKDDFEKARRDVNLSYSTNDLDYPPHQPTTTSEQDEDSLGFWAWNVNVSFPADVLINAQKARPALAYPQASWRKMYMSQPPATELHLCRRWRRSEQPAVKVETGITMNDLVSAATRSQSRWNEVYISSDRDWHLEGPIRYSHWPEKKAAAKTECPCTK